jgi:hypothetical protein
LKDGLKRAGRALARLYPMGLGLFWKAPLVLALVVVPEFIQHVVEVRLGMFDSLDAFRARQWDSTRMTVGAVKVAGLILAFFAAARGAWTIEHGGRWWDLRGLAWGRLALGAFIFFGIGSLPELLKGRIDDGLQQWLGGAWAILMLPGLFMLLAGLFGDRATPISAMWRKGWPWLLMTALLVVLGFAPAAWVHQMNHDWALGASPAVLWGLMIFDSLLVGLLAGLTGTALYLGHDAFVRGERERGFRSRAAAE